MPTADPAVQGWRRAAAIPYVWLIAFFLVPFLIVFKISLSETTIAQPPYLPVLDLAAGWEGLQRFLAVHAARHVAPMSGRQCLLRNGFEVEDIECIYSFVNLPEGELRERRHGGGQQGTSSKKLQECATVFHAKAFTPQAFLTKQK